MKPNLIEIDSAFTRHYRELLKIQQDIKVQLDSYPYDLEKSEITEAIIERMNAFWYFNSSNNYDLLERRSNPVSADFFTESCLLFIKTYFEQKGDYKVLSEVKIGGNQGVKPDILITQGDGKAVAVLELKVSDGWKRNEMEAHLSQREERIKEYYPNAWFGVLAYWNFIPADSPYWGTKYFGLLEHKTKSPTDIKIEHLIKLMEEHIAKV